MGSFLKVRYESKGRGGLKQKNEDWNRKIRLNEQECKDRNRYKMKGKDQIERIGMKGLEQIKQDKRGLNGQESTRKDIGGFELT